MSERLPWEKEKVPKVVVTAKIEDNIFKQAVARVPISASGFKKRNRNTAVRFATWVVITMPEAVYQELVRHGWKNIAVKKG